MVSEEEHSNERSLEDILRELAELENEVEEDVDSEVDPVPDSGGEDLERGFWRLDRKAWWNHRVRTTLEKMGIDDFDHTIEVIYRALSPAFVSVLIAIWSCFVGCVVFLQGLRDSSFLWWDGYVFAFNLDYRVLITLLGSTTVTVFGLSPNILSHLFNKHK